MIQETISEIENRIKNSPSVSDPQKAEMLELLSSLKVEIAQLSRTHIDEARSIAGLTQISAAEVFRSENDPQQVKSSLDNLAESVSEFETSHPTLVQVVNRICTTLSNLGI